MKQVIVIADDLTGAADAGVCFTRAGLSVVLALSSENNLLADVLVYSTESRHLQEPEARKRTRQAADQAKEAAYIYKKMDSTLRGFPGFELAELMDALEVEKVLVAPAYPAQGRTTISGIQLINGIPIEHTSFQNEVLSSDLVPLFRSCNRPIRTISLDTLRSNQTKTQNVFNTEGPAVIIGDAETDVDLQILVNLAIESDIRMFCGSAGLATALADRFPARYSFADLVTFQKQKGSILVIAGSRNSVTAGQVATARDLGIFVVELDFQHEEKSIWDSTINEVAIHLTLGQDVIITTSNSKDSPLGPMAVAERLAQLANFLVSTQKIGGLILTGGDIAMAVISMLRSSGVKLYGEFLPGIPLGIVMGGIQPDLPILTKAGGFGSKDALFTGIQFLK